MILFIEISTCDRRVARRSLRPLAAARLEGMAARVFVDLGSRESEAVGQRDVPLGVICLAVDLVGGYD